MWRPATERRRFGPENPTIIACQWPRNQVLWVIERRKDDPLSVKHKSDSPLSSDAGLLPLRQFDQRIGSTKEFAAVLDDPRHPDLIEHSFTEMVRMRIFGILAGYEDQNDHDTLRTDAVFKLIADRWPTDADLASQPTLSRFENQINIASLKRLR